MDELSDDIRLVPPQDQRSARRVKVYSSGLTQVDLEREYLLNTITHADVIRIAKLPINCKWKMWRDPRYVGLVVNVVWTSKSDLT